MVKKTAKRVLRKLKNWAGINSASTKTVIPKYGIFSYAQEGEDLVLSRLFGQRNEGFYVDVGAHHPIRFSNTYKFYKDGWTGINIDAMPDSMRLFDEVRPNDINLEAAVSDKEESLVFHIFNEPALNTFSKEEASKKDGLRNYKIVEKKTITTQTLNQILEKYLSPNQDIDFLSIDVEGLDLQVLKSIDLSKYQPKCILIEELKRYSVDELLQNSDVYSYLKDRNYEFFAKTFNTLFFKYK